YLHNRIETLHEAAERLRALCPGVRFAEAHGQMEESELETTMLSFLRGDADCLVATTIIESGLDIPQANTLIVERADQLGLAQAYQIRGRVGRSAERAFAYMLYPSEEALSAEAAARLATLADHTELGSGFRIAMRDLELRGAREPGELRALRDDLRDRFGPLPEPVESLLALGRVRIELARAGARTAEVRGERFAAGPIELDAAAVRRIRERVPTAIYESRAKT